jgi:hypothetical protein
MESIDLVFNANKDHGGREGPGYTEATVWGSLMCLVMLARCRGKTLAEITPPALIACTDFLMMFLSTAGRGDTMIPYGDSIMGTYRLDTVSLMALASGDSRWQNLRDSMLAAPAEDVKFHAKDLTCFYTLIFTEPGQGKCRVSLPVFCFLPSTGMVGSCREAAGGVVRLQLMGASVGGDHLHQDKGSFILEAFGDVLAIDRGKFGGDHPSENILTKAHMHNVLSPAMLGDVPEEQTCIVTEPILPCGSGDSRTLDVKIDTTGAWVNQPFKKHVRRIYSPEPTLFFFDDYVEVDRPRGATFHLHTNFPVEQRDGRFIVRGEHAALIVTPVWTVAGSRHGEDFMDGKERPVNHLALTSKPGTRYPGWSRSWRWSKPVLSPSGW